MGLVTSIFTKYVLGIDTNRMVDKVASGAKIVTTMIDEMNFSPEERSKAGLEFLRMNMDQNSERSRARRAIAMMWIEMLLGRYIPAYIISVLVTVWYPQFAPVAEAIRWVLTTIMATGTFMVLGFFFGSHLARGFTSILKKKGEIAMTLKQAALGAVGAEEVVTVGAAAVGLTAGTYTDVDEVARGALLRVEDADIWFTLDGATTPATDAGVLLKDGETLTLDSPSDIKNFSAIRTASTDAKLSVQYSR